MKRIITFGTFDVFHVGHINILERAKALGDYLIVGVSSDQLNFSKKQRFPIYSQDDRLKIISSLKFVDEVFVEESLEL
ncbi:TPA: adenylyltransferase/cytidyltransferase family protein, partial [Escherichia coli]